MNSVDLTPLYRSSIGFDRLASLLDRARVTDASTSSYPPYNIESFDDNKYAISLAVAGFDRADLEINLEKDVLCVRGEKHATDEHNYLYQGIANRSFERKFNLADHVEVVDAKLENGLLTISLVKEIPEEMKPRTIAINASVDTIGNNSEVKRIDSNSKAA